MQPPLRLEDLRPRFSLGGAYTDADPERLCEIARHQFDGDSVARHTAGLLETLET